MNARIFLIALLLVPSLTWSEPAPVVLKGPHYTVTSWAGEPAGQVTLTLMEALVVKYNSLFSFDLSRSPAPWNVTLYANKADFDAALAGQVDVLPSDYVYLHYSDPTRSQLAAWVPEPGSSIDEVKSLAFQGFFQYLWTFLPHPPAWVETGLANVFWNSRWDGKTITADPDQPFLETLQTLWKDRTPDIRALMEASGSLDRASGRDLEAWAWTSFLLDGPDPTYARLFGSVLAGLSPAATEEANRDAALARFRAVRDVDAAGADVRAWWKAKVGFRTRMDEGALRLKEKDPKGALAAFRLALALKPEDNAARYYAALASYEAKDYPTAEAGFTVVEARALPPGLLAYARGLTAFALKKYTEAREFLVKARTEDEATYAKLVAPVLELIR